MDSELNTRIDTLEKQMQEAIELVNILWHTRQPVGGFRVYFKKDRFANEKELETYLVEKSATVAGVIAAKGDDGQLQGTIWKMYNVAFTEVPS